MCCISEAKQYFQGSWGKVSNKNKCAWNLGGWDNWREWGIFFVDASGGMFTVFLYYYCLLI